MKKKTEIETVGFHSSCTELLNYSVKKSRGTFYWTANTMTGTSKIKIFLLKNKQQYWKKPGHKL